MTILTGDNDLFQALEGDRVRIARAVRKDGIQYLDEVYFLKKFEGVSLDNLLLYRVLAGDRSDKIPGVLKPSIAKAYAEKFSTVDELLGSGELEHSRDDIIRNQFLMELKPVDYRVYKQDDLKEVYRLAMYYDLKSFLKWSEGQFNGL